MSTKIQQPNKRLGPSRRSLIRSEVAMRVEILPLQEGNKPSKFGIDAISVDISYVGIGVLTTVPIKRSEFANLTICPGSDREFQVQSRMVHYERSGQLYRVGFEFIFDDDPDRLSKMALLGQFVV